MPIGVYLRPTLAERFWRKVLKTESCWLWLGCVSPNGYGYIQINKKPYLVHRLSYEMANNTKLPNGHSLEIDHLCRNKRCVNPEHLEIVSHQVNNNRGVGVTARHAKATHCPQGHPYDLFNTYRRPDGGRDCRICQKKRMEVWRARNSF